jgi:4-hydroxybenzoate polyprenyltransferase
MHVLLKVKSYLDLCRVSNLPTVWTNVLAALILSGTGFNWPTYLILSLSMSLFYSGGMCLNDLCDAGADRIHKPFRPIPSNRVSIQSVWLFTGLLFGAALGLLLPLPFPMAFWAGLGLLLLIIVYDSAHKKNPLSVLMIAGCRLLVFVVSSIALTGKVGWYVVVAGLVQFVYVLVLSVVARYEGTLPKKFGFPVIPWMLASISLLDGIVMGVFVSSFWLVAGISGMVLTRLGQRYVRGD